jgi:hypothetical protein
VLIAISTIRINWNSRPHPISPSPVRSFSAKVRCLASLTLFKLKLLKMLEIFCSHTKVEQYKEINAEVLIIA